MLASTSCGLDGRVRPAKVVEGIFPHVGVADVELLGQLAADLFRGIQQLVEVALAAWPGRPGAAPSRKTNRLSWAVVPGEGVGVEPLVGVLVRALVIEPGLPHRRDDDPVARQVDGVAITLVDRRHLPAGEGPVERVLRSFAFDGDDEPPAAGPEFAEHGVGELAVHLDVFLAGERVAVLVVDRPRVAEDAAKDVGEEVGEKLLLLERIGLGETEQPGPLLRVSASPRCRRGDGSRPDGAAERRDGRAAWLRQARLIFSAEIRNGFSHAGRRWRPAMREGDVQLQQDGKPFLREMLVMRQYFSDTFGFHHLHRNAVRKAVFLIRAGFVEVQAGKECLVCLAVNRHRLVVIEVPYREGGALPEHSTRLAKGGQEFR